MTTIISYHRDHTYAMRTAYSFNLRGTGTFSVMDNNGNITSIKVEPGVIVRFDCKLRHQFVQTSPERVGLFWWGLQRSKGYFPPPELQAAIDQVDAELDAELGGSRLPKFPRQLIREFGLPHAGIVAKVSSEVVAKMLEDLSKHSFGFDPSRYVRNREICWLGAEPDLRNRTGKLDQAPIDSRILKFMRRIDPASEVALIGRSWL